MFPTGRFSCCTRMVWSSGVVGVTLHRAPGVAVVADCHSGALRLKLDDSSIPAVINDVHWESEGASKAADRYELRINSGVVQLTLDTRAGRSQAPNTPPAVEPRPAKQADLRQPDVQNTLGEPPRRGPWG